MYLVLVKLRNNCIQYLSKLKIDSSVKLCPLSRHENISVLVKTLKLKRSLDTHDVKQAWTSMDCNYDPNIEFYCNGRLPVFNEWTSENAKKVRKLKS